MKNRGVQGGSLSDFNSLSCLPRPIAASQLNSNQWKSLIIPTSCNAAELISVPAGQPYNANFKSFGQTAQLLQRQDIKRRLMRCSTVQSFPNQVTVSIRIFLSFTVCGWIVSFDTQICFSWQSNEPRRFHLISLFGLTANKKRLVVAGRKS